LPSKAREGMPMLCTYESPCGLTATELLGLWTCGTTVVSYWDTKVQSEQYLLVAWHSGRINIYWGPPDCHTLKKEVGSLETQKSLVSWEILVEESDVVHYFCSWTNWQTSLNLVGCSWPPPTCHPQALWRSHESWQPELSKWVGPRWPFRVMFAGVWFNRTLFHPALSYTHTGSVLKKLLSCLRLLKISVWYLWFDW
jgi:hypothetical protein